MWKATSVSIGPTALHFDRTLEALQAVIEPLPVGWRVVSSWTVSGKDRYAMELIDFQMLDLSIIGKVNLSRNVIDLFARGDTLAITSRR